VPYPPRPPTGQAVAAALKRAGFNRSVVLPGTGRYNWDGRLVRGSERHSDGYEVKTADGQITVRWRTCGPVVNPDAEHRKRMGWLQRYADTLVGDGFCCRLSEPDGKVIVHGRRR
jgi:hypothetical protein